MIFNNNINYFYLLLIHMLGPSDKKIIDQIIKRDEEANRLLNRTLRGDYAIGKGLPNYSDCNCEGSAMVRTANKNGFGVLGGQLKTVQNMKIQQGLPSIGAVGPRVIDVSQMDMEGEGFADFIKGLVKNISKGISVGKKIYEKAKPIVEKSIDVAQKVAPVVSDVIQSVKDIKEEMKKKSDEEQSQPSQEGSGKKKQKSLKQVVKMVEKMKGKKDKKGGAMCGGKKVKPAVVPPMEDVEETGGKKSNKKDKKVVQSTNPWICFLTMKKLKPRELPKKGTAEHKKMMDEYQKFKTK